MNFFIFIVGLISSIIALTAISVTAINEAIYYRLFITAMVCSVMSISACMFFILMVDGYVTFHFFLN